MAGRRQRPAAVAPGGSRDAGRGRPRRRWDAPAQRPSSTRCSGPARSRPPSPGLRSCATSHWRWSGARCPRGPPESGTARDPGRRPRRPPHRGAATEALFHGRGGSRVRRIPEQVRERALRRLRCGCRAGPARDQRIPGRPEHRRPMCGNDNPFWERQANWCVGRRCKSSAAKEQVTPRRSASRARVIVRWAVKRR